MFPSKYLRGAELTAPVTVTIASIKPETMYKPGAGNVTGFVLYCEKASRGVVLTRPLALAIAQALGDPDTDTWPGKRIELYPQAMTVAGKAQVAIRARAANGKPQEVQA
jgi:hypothetical protein